MNQAEIFSPFFAMLFLTGLVWLYLFAKRIPFLNSLELKPNQVTPAELARLSPPSVSNPSDNLKNLFELPVLFYACVLYLYVTHQVDGVAVSTAWAFVMLRAAHSAVHCTFNSVMIRFGCYALSALALGVLIVRAAIGHFGG